MLWSKCDYSEDATEQIQLWLCLLLQSEFDYDKDATKRVQLRQGRYGASLTMAMFAATEQV